MILGEANESKQMGHDSDVKEDKLDSFLLSDGTRDTTKRTASHDTKVSGLE